MFGRNIIGPILTISGTISNISRFLNMAERFVPLCGEIKPTISKLGKIFKTKTRENYRKEDVINNNSSKYILKKSSTNLPVFFQ